MHGDYETHPEHATPLHGGCDGIGVRALHDSGQCGIVDFIELRVGSNELFGTDVNGRRVCVVDEQRLVFLDCILISDRLQRNFRIRFAKHRKQRV